MALINVALPGATEVSQMDESDLLKLEGGFEDENEVVLWVQYHLKTTGDMVHRSAHVTLKTVAGSGETANFG
jgi:hypothetical protein